jgi:hypothetical protein
VKLAVVDAVSSVAGSDGENLLAEMRYVSTHQPRYTTITRHVDAKIDLDAIK